MAGSEETFSCTEVNESSKDYGLRIAALFAILAVSAIGGALPWICRSARLQPAFFFGTVFAGGVVLATGFVHILPDAASNLSNPCLKLSTEFPWAFVFCGTALLFTFMLEYFLRLVIRRSYGLSNDPQEAFNHNHDATDLDDLAELGTTKGESRLMGQAMAKLRALDVSAETERAVARLCSTEESYCRLLVNTTDDSLLSTVNSLAAASCQKVDPMVMSMAHSLISSLPIGDNQKAAGHLVISKDDQAASALLGAEKEEEKVALVTLLINKSGRINTEAEELEVILFYEPSYNPRKPFQVIRFKKAYRSSINDYFTRTNAIQIQPCDKDKVPLPGSEPNSDVMNAALHSNGNYLVLKNPLKQEVSQLKGWKN